MSEEILVHALAAFRPPPDRPRADTFLIEGVLTDKVSIVASYPGKGKTSALVTLALIVAGLIKCDDVLRIKSHRHVIYVSEHPEQVEKILAALAQTQDLPLDLIFEWIHVVEAARMRPEHVVAVAPDYRQFVRQDTRNGHTVDVRPWVIFDTTASTFDLEDENSNSAVSRLVACVKQQFDNLPTTLVMHTSKQHKHGTADAMTARGASAAEGDVAQVVYLTETEDDPGARFLEIARPKHRFVATVDAIKIESHITTLNVVDEYGCEQQESVLWCWLAGMSRTDRQIEQEQRQRDAEARNAEAAARMAAAVEAEVLEVIEREPAGITKRAIRAAVKRKAAAIDAAIEALVEAGAVTTRVTDRRAILHFAASGTRWATQRLSA
jgi:hypothetical protein